MSDCAGTVEARSDPIRCARSFRGSRSTGCETRQRHAPQRFEGTLVFADISGFTELTEALAKRGREGAEEIAGVVDAAFARADPGAPTHITPTC